MSNTQKGDKLSKLKKAVYIDEEDIPVPIRKRVDWSSVFDEVPEGKARVIDEVHYTTIRQALKRLQDEGKFKTYSVETRKTGNVRTTYVKNPRRSV
jgi:high-affinity K+ transport system ATPase subunit B